MTETPEQNEPDGEQQGDEEFDPAEIEDDPAYNPDEEELQEIKGG